MTHAEKEERAAPITAGEVLRQKAERLVRERPGDLGKAPVEDAQRLVHELQVHQIELELQNEELRRSQQETLEALAKYANLYDFAPLGYFTCDADGLILEINLTGARMLGVDRDRLLHKPFMAHIVAEDQDIFWRQRRRVSAKGEPRSCEIRFRPKDGRHFYVQMKSVAVKDSGGRFSRILTAITDVNERVLAQQALQKAHDELEQRVAERTAALRAEIARHKTTAEKLQAKTAELEQRSLGMEEANTAIPIHLFPVIIRHTSQFQKSRTQQGFFPGFSQKQ